jgi:hypothetical protein
LSHSRRKTSTSISVKSTDYLNAWLPLLDFLHIGDVI